MIYDIEFTDGSKLSCTPYHKFILNDGTRIEAKDLTKEHKLAKFKLPIIDNIDSNIISNMAYTQGFYSGDGSKNRKEIWLYGEKIKLLDKLNIKTYSDQSNNNTNRVLATIGI